MNQAAIETFSTIGVAVLCIALGIIALTIFFKIVGRFEKAGKPESIAIRGILGKQTLVTVHLTGGEKFERVKFVGFTNSESFKTHLPYELSGMVILEDEQQQKYFVRSKAIRLIEVPAEEGSSSAKAV